MPGKTLVDAQLESRCSAVSPRHRLSLAFAAVSGMYIVLPLPLLLPYDKILLVGVAATDLVSFVLFVVPVVTLVPTALQLKFWHLFLLGSLVFLFVILGFLFRESPTQLFAVPYPGSVLPGLGLLLAVSSCLVYLLLLRSAVARVRLKGERS